MRHTIAAATTTTKTTTLLLFPLLLLLTWSRLLARIWWWREERDVEEVPSLLTQFAEKEKRWREERKGPACLPCVGYLLFLLFRSPETSHEVGKKRGKMCEKKKEERRKCPPKENSEKFASSCDFWRAKRHRKGPEEGLSWKVYFLSIKINRGFFLSNASEKERLPMLWY